MVLGNLGWGARQVAHDSGTTHRVSAAGSGLYPSGVHRFVSVRYQPGGRTPATDLYHLILLGLWCRVSLGRSAPNVRRLAVKHTQAFLIYVPSSIAADAILA